MKFYTSSGTLHIEDRTEHRRSCKYPRRTRHSTRQHEDSNPFSNSDQRYITSPTPLRTLPAYRYGRRSVLPPAQPPSRAAYFHLRVRL